MYKWRVLEGPRREVPWAKRWSASGVPMAALHWSAGAELYRVCEIRGRDAVTLRIDPPVEWVSGPEAVERAKARRLRQCARVASEFARTYGYKFQAEIMEAQLTEFGFPTPGLAATGTPGVDKVWIDESEGDGEAEIETASPQIAVAVADLPRWKDSVDRKLGGIEEELRTHRVYLDRIVKLHEESALNERRVVEALISRVGGEAGQAPAPADPYAPEVA